MITSYNFEGKTKEEVINNALKQLNTNIEDIYLIEEEQEAKLFKSKKYLVKIYKKEDILSYIKDYINNFSRLSNINITCEVREKNDIINVTLVSNSNSILIGKNGKTLSALQHLLKQTLNSQVDKNLKLFVDISNYKSKKVKNLQYQVNQIAKEVLKTKTEVKLDPMNSYERRIIHTVVSEYKNLKTKSIGEEPNRYVVISYEED
ncbi:MAG: KH domain-containing protein [Clostridium sp.]|nr:KH domain-containing protein [Clostridium sp.]MCM1443765.1 KH domain-containing protein [Candidatus Amulumruptor caecigallinarius]